MKKIKLAVLALLFLAGTTYAQEKSKGWPEMKAFHSIMAATFHPSEEGDLKPLKLMADSLYNAARAWQNSPIPDTYKPDETKATLEKLVEQCGGITKAVKTNVSDEKLKKMIAEAHDTFHKIVGECKKTEDKKGAHDGHNHD